MRHILVPEDLTAHEIEAIFAISHDLETKYDAGLRDALLPGRGLALVFEKPSLRTRVSFEAAMAHLGGSSVFLGEEAGFSSSRESVADFGRVLSQYADAIVCRSKAHDTILALAAAATVPVRKSRRVTPTTSSKFSLPTHFCASLRFMFVLRDVRQARVAFDPPQHPASGHPNFENQDFRK